MSFYDEIKDYSIADLNLIIATQQDLYSEDEIAQIKELLSKKVEQAKQEELRRRALAEARKKRKRKKKRIHVACLPQV